MKEFLFLFRGGDVMDGQGSPEAMQHHMQKWMNWMQQLSQEGKFTGGQPLTSQGKVVYSAGKKITDGPFAEGKEVVGGYLLVKANDLNGAVEISKSCPIFEYNGTVEVREIQEIPM